MTRIMYDGITVSALPTGAPLYAGYLDGHWPTVAALRARFPKARIVEIAVFASTHAGHVLDVEPGDATPSQAVAWVKARRAAGADPTIYCNASTWPVVRAAFRVAGVAEPHYWIAQYDGKPVIPAGAVAKQYQNTAGWDRSIVADYWPGVDPKPQNKPPEKSNMELNDQIKLNAWVPKAWPTDAGLKDGKLAVGTALGSGYGHARGAHEGVEELKTALAALAAEVAAIKKKLGA